MKHIDEELLRRYKSQSPFYKKLIQLFALSHEPMATNIAYRCLQRLNLKPNHQPFTTRGVGLCIDTLVRESYLRRTNANFFEINSSIENEVVKDLYQTKDFSTFADVLQAFMPIYMFSTWNDVTVKRYYRSIRIALLQGDFQRVNNLSRSAAYSFEKEFQPNFIYNIIIEPFDEQWLKSMKDEVIYQGAVNALNQLWDNFDYHEEFFNFLEKHKKKTEGAIGDGIRDIIKWGYVFKGDFKKAEELNMDAPQKDSRYFSFKTGLEAIKGNHDAAEKALKTAIKLYKKETRQRKVSVPFMAIQFGYLSKFVGLTKEDQEDIQNYIANLSIYRPLTTSLGALLHAQVNNMNEVRSIFADNEDEGIALVYLNYAKFWIYRSQAGIDFENLELLYNNARDNDLKFPMLLISELLAQAYTDINETSKAEHYQKIHQSLKSIPVASILNLVPKVEPWERALKALVNLSDSFEKGDIATQKDKRLIWLIDFKKENVEVKEQKIGKNGKWTKGRTVSSDRLTTIAQTEDYVTDQDKLIIQAVTEGSGYYSYSDFSFSDNLIRALVGHPNLYLNNTQRTFVEIIEEKPQLVIQKVNNKFELSFNVDVTEIGVQLLKETPTRYKAVDVTEKHLMIANAIGNDKIQLPSDAENELAQIAKGFSKVVSVQSEVLADDIDIRKVDSDPRPHVHLLPVGDGFQLEMYVKPFGAHPPYYKPSEGGQIIITEIEGERIQTERNLEEEKNLAREVIKTCPSLGNARKLSKIWEFDTPDACLEILSELQPLKAEEKVIVEWPKGERLKLKATASFDQFSMSIKGSTDWFEANGTLKVGEDLVMSMKEVLGLLNQSNSRFIQLQNGEFLALTNRFRQQLQALEAYSDVTKDGLRFHPLAALAVEEMSSEAKDLEADAAWQSQLKKLKDGDKKRPRVPSTFKATLRPYQKEGFNWLMKLSYWGVGACLADDMGLGKTVQALAAILARAQDGPTLIVCPASVRINWEREAFKFAPTMNPIQFGNGDREQILNDLKPFDMLITSYGLLQSEEENFSKIQFSTIVLDEAQAIKNRAAKRSKAAMELNGDFKIITTGTPIENHLGELWNLFRFINPGLLGAMNRFRERFAIPIEKYGDEERREQLKKLIRPFILRRRKSQVLLELPEKTEIVLSVELSPQEKAFYEALRQTALEKLKDVQPGDGQTHLQILAEITRLRQACCNPGLVKGGEHVKSSKLELFNDTIDELLENDHKVLVFSQFVQHLKILEKSLKQKKIAYQYLDGSTSQKKRQQSIDAFQNGEGDVFLISLKAGGVGLNLTAADYVIHMDPWWNPAVEDQASDRAHRIGQKRPVTIYRLVTEGTIEEKIVKLHDEKRDLADSLLSGTNKGHKMSADDLMDLIKEGMK